MVFIGFRLIFCPTVIFPTVVTFKVNPPASLTSPIHHQCTGETISCDHYSHFSPDLPLPNGHIFHYCYEVPANFLTPTCFAITFCFTLLHIFLYCANSSFFTVLLTLCCSHYFTSWLLLTSRILVPCEFPFCTSLQVHVFHFTSLLPSTLQLVLFLASTTFLCSTLFFFLFYMCRIFMHAMSLWSTLDICTPFPSNL